MENFKSVEISRRMMKLYDANGKMMKTKEEFTEWAYDKFDKYNIRRPESYTEQELVDLNPTVPVDFIKEHVRKRDKK
jgi:hypothetical protein